MVTKTVEAKNTTPCVYTVYTPFIHIPIHTVSLALCVSSLLLSLLFNPFDQGCFNLHLIFEENAATTQNKAGLLFSVIMNIRSFFQTCDRVSFVRELKACLSPSV